MTPLAASARQLPPSLRMPYRWPEADQLALVQGAGGAPLAFRDFIRQVSPRFRLYPHVDRLIAVLQQVADGERDRVMVFMPVRHGKSEVISRLFAAYYLYRHPQRFVGLTAYAAGLAHTLSRAARDNYRRAGGLTRPDADAVSHWETAAGGGLWAAGVGGPITGKGFHCGIIDDPVKNAEEAASEAVRARNNDWYDSTFTTREEPGAAIVVVQTRWHESDLAGYILEKEAVEPERWHIVRMEAIKETEPHVYEGDPAAAPAYYRTCSFEPDPRPLGAALAPARYDAAKLGRTRARIGPYFWNALYQQRPRPRAGGMFQRGWFDIVERLPAPPLRFVRYWDKAGTEGAGAYTAGVLLAAHGGATYVVDLIMGRWGAAEREQVIRDAAAADRARYGDVQIVVEQEPGSGGKESAENTIRGLAGYRVLADRPSGDKALRAEPVAAQARIRNVKLVRGAWNTRFLDILTAFPTGTIKDPVDALSGAFAHLARSAGGMGVKKYA